jgi:hypothetical protein
VEFTTAPPSESQFSSCDVSPLSDALADGELADYSGDMGIDPTTILDGIPPLLAPAIRFPDPLPGTPYILKPAIQLDPIDYSSMTASEHAKQKRKRRLQVKHLSPANQTMVSAAINRMESLLVMCCGFPNEETCWTLANMANNWACKKYGLNLALTEGSNYKNLVSSIH